MPDFVANAGGVVDIHGLRMGWDEDRMRAEVLKHRRPHRAASWRRPHEQGWTPLARRRADGRGPTGRRPRRPDATGGVMKVAAPPQAPVALSDRYTAEEGTVVLSGIQALVRMMLEQRRLDARARAGHRHVRQRLPGLAARRAGQGAGRAAGHTGPAGIVFQPGLNEELAATAVAGTQLLGELDGRRHDGVTGFWYGKSPGLDRAADAIRHGNLSGTAPLGGAVALIGDDPAGKSSTVPSSCEPMCRSLMVPVLAPGSVAELVSFGLHAVALSRHTGLWAG